MGVSHVDRTYWSRDLSELVCVCVCVCHGEGDGGRPLMTEA